MKKKIACMITAMTLIISQSVTAFAAENLVQGLNLDVGSIGQGTNLDLGNAGDLTNLDLGKVGDVINTDQENTGDTTNTDLGNIGEGTGIDIGNIGDLINPGEGNQGDNADTGSGNDSGSGVRIITDGNDAGGNMATATEIGLGNAATDSITSAGDEDFFAFSTETDGYVNLTFTHGDPINGEGEYSALTSHLWVMSLLDADGNELNKWSIKKTAGNTVTENIGLPAGKHYIKVAACDGKWNPTGYSVKADFTATLYESETNNSFATADEMPLNTEIGGNLMTKQDTDFYRFNVEKKGYVSVTVSHVATSDSFNYWTFSLYKNSDLDNEVESWNIKGSEDSVTGIEYDLEPGTYYVKVVKGSDEENHFTTLAYKLRVNFREQSSDLVKAFVIRLYEVGLGRYPEQLGLDAWTKELKSGKANAVDVVKGVLCSPEYSAKGKTNQQVVRDCYRSMLDREPDDVGFADWTSNLDAGMSVNAIFAGFVGSGEFIALCETYHISPGIFQLTEERDKNAGVTKFVSRLYTQALGRSYDVEGLNYWCGKINADTSKSNIMDVATNGFFHSEEFKKKELNNTEFVTVLYHTYLDREPEAEGLENWVGLLDRGEKTRDQVMEGFAYSPEFANIMARYGL